MMANDVRKTTRVTIANKGSGCLYCGISTALTSSTTGSAYMYLAACVIVSVRVEFSL